ncbi:YjbN-like Dus1p tRNA dihydouriding synthase Tim barrel [Cryptosporidium canis]|uniref:YjbN-like Dus1p tRNA dihydouriding synthase Tim barrel n=1 Tax=Cryptosporidium canis TaxID=195482 RepID=A0ABQ8P2C7_9CRYT|nr:YjbN-like Dus1p tRNA dihydouriding synthase Tim barrel [Cryptosporidium canis]KAJ1607860.1 YjbN-like Dus1p tRNA dihydouriding synthase Tim barrel [Cryptosporidium canis]
MESEQQALSRSDVLQDHLEEDGAVDRDGGGRHGHSLLRRRGQTDVAGASTLEEESGGESAGSAVWRQHSGEAGEGLGDCPEVATKGSFGAALFKSPLRVARIVNACNRKLRDLGLSDTRISVKTRIGVDEFDTYQHLYNFVSLVSGVHVNNQNIKDFASIFQDTDDINLLDYSQGNFIGADTFIIHARKAWLKGINPSKNRSVPKLKYQWAYLLTQDFPSLRFILNGGVTTIEDSVSILNGEWFMSWYSRHKEGLTDSNTGSQIEKKIRLDTQDSEDALASSPEGGKSTRDGVPPESELMQAYERLYRAISAGTWENKIKGVMIGREVMNNPFILAKVDRMIYGEDASSASHPTNGLLLTRRDVLERYSEYLSTIQPRNIQNDGQFTTGELHMYLKPAFGILHGLPGTKHWRRILSDLIFKHKQDLACSGGSNPRDILLYSISLFEKDYPEILDST